MAYFYRNNDNAVQYEILQQCHQRNSGIWMHCTIADYDTIGLRVCKHVAVYRSGRYCNRQRIHLHPSIFSMSRQILTLTITDTHAFKRFNISKCLLHRMTERC